MNLNPYLAVINEDGDTTSLRHAIFDLEISTQGINPAKPEIEQVDEILDRDKHGSCAIYDYVVINCKHERLGANIAAHIAEKYPKQPIALVMSDTEIVKYENIAVVPNISKAAEIIKNSSR